MVKYSFVSRVKSSSQLDPGWEYFVQLKIVCTCRNQTVDRYDLNPAFLVTKCGEEKESKRSESLNLVTYFGILSHIRSRVSDDYFFDFGSFHRCHGPGLSGSKVSVGLVEGDRVRRRGRM